MLPGNVSSTAFLTKPSGSCSSWFDSFNLMQCDDIAFDGIEGALLHERLDRLSKRSEAFGRTRGELLLRNQDEPAKLLDEGLVARAVRPAFITHGQASPVGIGFEEVVVQGRLVEKRQDEWLMLVHR